MRRAALLTVVGGVLLVASAGVASPAGTTGTTPPTDEFNSRTMGTADATGGSANPGSPGSTADNAVIVDATAITGVEPTRTIIPGGSTEVSSPGATITAGDITSFEKSD
jgi:hypothetical protein